MSEPLELPPSNSASYINKGFEIISITSDSVNSISVNARVLNFVGFGLKTDSERSKVKQILVEKIEVMEINPSPDYVEQSFNQAAVRKHLERTKFRSPLYMICARKVALRGAKLLDRNNSGQSIQAAATLPVHIHGLETAKISASGSHQHHEERRHDVYAIHPFVFAYRLHEIVYNAKLNNAPYDCEVLRFHSIRGRPLTDEEVEDATAELVDLEDYSEGYTLVDEIDDSGVAEE